MSCGRRDTDARMDRHDLSVDNGRLRQASNDSQRESDRIPAMVRVLDEYGELVATEACDGVLLGDAGIQAPGSFDEQRIPGRVSQAVVHGLEVVKVDEHYGRRLVAWYSRASASPTLSPKRTRFARLVRGSWKAS